MNKLDKIKEVIKENYVDGGLFFTRNFEGDTMETIYEDNDITIDICRYYEYFEVFGLNEDEENELINYYNSLGDD